MSVTRITILLFAICGLGRVSRADLEAEVETYTASTVAPPARDENSIFASTDAAKSREWNATLSVYLWAASMFNNVGGDETGVSFEDVLNNLDFALMARANVDWNRFTLLVDYFNADVEAKRTTSLYRADVEVKEDILDVRLGYLIIDRPMADGKPGIRLIGEMGARYWDLRLDAKATLPPLPEAELARVSEKWWDFLVGLRAEWMYTEKVGLSLEGNVGGFDMGDSAQYDYELAFYFHYRFAKHAAVVLGYRFLQYRRKTESEEFKQTITGPVIGVSFPF